MASVVVSGNLNRRANDGVAIRIRCEDVRSDHHGCRILCIAQWRCINNRQHRWLIGVIDLDSPGNWKAGLCRIVRVWITVINGHSVYNISRQRAWVVRPVLVRDGLQSGCVCGERILSTQRHRSTTAVPCTSDVTGVVEDEQILERSVIPEDLNCRTIQHETVNIGRLNRSRNRRDLVCVCWSRVLIVLQSCCFDV